MKSLCAPALAATLACLWAAGAAMAQSPVIGEAAMQPSKGTWLLHEMFQYERYRADRELGTGEIEKATALTQLSYGVTSQLSLRLDAPIEYRRAEGLDGAGDDDDFGLGDSQILAKYRVWQHDQGAVDTERLALIGGLEIPGTDSGFSNDSSTDSVNPIIGAVFSTVHGRHGFNADALWEFSTNDGPSTESADTLRADASYLFRIAPEEYSMETKGAWYGVLELNAWYETNGDSELYVSPGVMYEARRFTLDAAVMIPAWQDLDHRPEMDFKVMFGIRIPF